MNTTAGVQHLHNIPLVEMHDRAHAVARQALPKCVILPNFAVISQTVAEMWRFVDFSRRSRRHLG